LTHEVPLTRLRVDTLDGCRCTGFADDYAHMVAGCLDLYEAGGGTSWLTWAVELQDVMDQLFWDPAAGVCAWGWGCGCGCR
jgi:uncharacterized protein YyaL (SSP411 family)